MISGLVGPENEKDQAWLQTSTSDAAGEMAKEKAKASAKQDADANHEKEEGNAWLQASTSEAAAAGPPKAVGQSREISVAGLENAFSNVRDYLFSDPSVMVDSASFDTDTPALVLTAQEEVMATAKALFGDQPGEDTYVKSKRQEYQEKSLERVVRRISKQSPSYRRSSAPDSSKAFKPNKLPEGKEKKVSIFFNVDEYSPADRANAFNLLDAAGFVTADQILSIQTRLIEDRIQESESVLGDAFPDGGIRMNGWKEGAHPLLKEGRYVNPGVTPSDTFPKEWPLEEKKFSSERVIETGLDEHSEGSRGRMKVITESCKEKQSKLIKGLASNIWDKLDAISDVKQDHWTSLCFASFPSEQDISFSTQAKPRKEAQDERDKKALKEYGAYNPWQGVLFPGGTGDQQVMFLLVPNRETKLFQFRVYNTAKGLKKYHPSLVWKPKRRAGFSHLSTRDPLLRDDGPTEFLQPFVEWSALFASEVLNSPLLGTLLDADCLGVEDGRRFLYGELMTSRFSPAARSDLARGYRRQMTLDQKTKYLATRKKALLTQYGAKTASTSASSFLDGDFASSIGKNATSFLEANTAGDGNKLPITEIAESAYSLDEDPFAKQHKENEAKENEAKLTTSKSNFYAPLRVRIADAEFFWGRHLRSMRHKPEAKKLQEELNKSRPETRLAAYELQREKLQMPAAKSKLEFYEAVDTDYSQVDWITPQRAQGSHAWSLLSAVARSFLPQKHLEVYKEWTLRMKLLALVRLSETWTKIEGKDRAHSVAVVTLMQNSLPRIEKRLRRLELKATMDKSTTKGSAAARRTSKLD
ncbi:unnamed protein product [Amoebophrya sp. A25]|nr:unnamed protein product [Amoebophrya sp. A25]|eukprot:GSA25T00002881001.1